MATTSPSPSRLSSCALSEGSVRRVSKIPRPDHVVAVARTSIGRSEPASAPALARATPLRPGSLRLVSASPLTKPSCEPQAFVSVSKVEAFTGTGRFENLLSFTLLFFVPMYRFKSPEKPYSVQVTNYSLVTLLLHFVSMLLKHRYALPLAGHAFTKPPSNVMPVTAFALSILAQIVAFFGGPEPSSHSASSSSAISASQQPGLCI